MGENFNVFSNFDLKQDKKQSNDERLSIASQDNVMKFHI